MLQNEPLVTEIGFDTAENGLFKVWVTKQPTRDRGPLDQMNSTFTHSSTRTTSSWQKRARKG